MDNQVQLQNPIVFQLGDGAYWLSVIVGVGGLLVIVGVGVLAWWLRNKDKELLESLNNAPSRQIIPYYLENRNEFWLSFGQIIVAILLIFALTILLITRTIDSQAGVPLLSAIAGFAIAKSTSTTRSGRVPADGLPPDSSSRGQPRPANQDEGVAPATTEADKPQ